MRGRYQSKENGGGDTHVMHGRSLRGVMGLLWHPRHLKAKTKDVQGMKLRTSGINKNINNNAAEEAVSTPW